MQASDEFTGARRIELGHLADIRAADEGLVAVAAQHDRTQPRRLHQRGSRRNQLAHQGAIDDIELSRIGHRDMTDDSACIMLREPDGDGRRGAAAHERSAASASAIARLNARTAAPGPSRWFHTAVTTARKSAPAVTRGAQMSGVMPPIATPGTGMISLHQASHSG